MELEIELGLASVYFVSQPKQGVGVLNNPTLLLTRKTLCLEDFAYFLACRQAKRGPVDEELVAEAAQMLQDFMADGSLSAGIGLDKSMLVVAPDVESGLLGGLKRLKLRGIVQVMAICSGTRQRELEEAEAQLARAFEDHLLPTDVVRSMLAYGPIKGLCVVSGLRQTIFSTTKKDRDLIGSHPEIASDITSVQEPL